MDFSIETISIISGAVATGIVIPILLTFSGKTIKKSKKSKLAKELKKDKEIKFIIENIKQINSQLQLETTDIAKSLDSFNNDEEKNEVFENKIISERASRKELTEKDKKKAIKVGI